MATLAKGGLTPSADRIQGVVIGRVVSFVAGELRVQVENAAPTPARLNAAVSDAAAAEAAREHAEVALAFERGDPARPIVLAVLRRKGPALVREQLLASVDGRQVVIEGREEVTLRCGKASLTLNRDGKVVLRGVNVVSQADEVHKIRGGKVQIN